MLVHANLGATFLEMGQPEEAIHHLETALNLQPKYAVAESNLGFALSELDRTDEAISHLQKALESDPDLADAHYNLGNIFLKLRRATEATSEYKQAVELDPNDERALNNLSWILATWPDEKNRDGASALKFATRADALSHAQSPVIVATLAAALAENRRFPEAATTATRAAELAAAQGNDALADSIRAQLRFYQSGAAFRQQATTR